MDFNDFNLMDRLVAVHGTAADMDPRGHRGEKRSVTVRGSDSSGRNRMSLDIMDLFVSQEGQEEEGRSRLRRDRREESNSSNRRGNLRKMAWSLALTPQESIIDRLVLDSPLTELAGR